MLQSGSLIGIAALLVLVVGPLLLGLVGLFRTRRTSAGEAPQLARPWDWKLTIASALLYALAFNLTFIIQELFLVIPKALTPGLLPILFHNNHTWAGENPLARLFQGTGALAIFVTGLICALVLRHRPARSAGWRLFLIWMAYNGFLQSLPQVVIGAVEPENDVGMAMALPALQRGGKNGGRPPGARGNCRGCAFTAGTVSKPCGEWRRNQRRPNSYRVHVACGDTAGIGGDPAHHSIPRPPQLGGGRSGPGGGNHDRGRLDASRGLGVRDVKRAPSRRAVALGSKSIVYAVGALLALLLVFQLLLRPGVRFY